MIPDKQLILSQIIRQLSDDLTTSEQALAVALDTAVHADCLGSSKYETMGLEASYLAQGQGQRLLELERALTWFKQLSLPEPSTKVGLSSLIKLEDEEGASQWLWLAADAGGLKVDCAGISVTVVTPKSPLGRALIGKSMDEMFDIYIAGNTRSYVITSLV